MDDRDPDADQGLGMVVGGDMEYEVTEALRDGFGRGKGLVRLLLEKDDQGIIFLLVH